MNTTPIIPIDYILYARKSSESKEKQIPSIDSQIKELTAIAQRLNLNVVSILTEEKSAKEPGNRPIFSKLMTMITQGKANGILCWKLDRLARNPVDGGSICWALQSSVIQTIQTCSNTHYPTDNMLPIQIEFGMANQFILDLSVNTKRGMRARVSDGWFPHKPPIGYLNNKHDLPDFKPIYKDPVKFRIVKDLWTILVQKRCTIKELHKIAREKGLKMPKGKPLSLSKCHELFRNPFYYGSFRWKKEVYLGKHEPMISKQLFDKAQEVLDGRSFTCKQTHTFAFTGLMRCGECGAAITAEVRSKTQKNGNKHRYIYYRCSKRLGPCSQPHVREELLEEQIKDILKTITIPASYHEWTIEELKADSASEIKDTQRIKATHRKLIDACDKELIDLIRLRANNEIGPEELTTARQKLLNEKHNHEEILKDTDNRIDGWISRADKLLAFSATAKTRFEKGGLDQKREVLIGIGSNLFLKDQKLSISVKEPLKLVQKIAPKIKNLHARLKLPLEPLNSEASQRVKEAYTTQNQIWGG